ncbi:MAG: SDR family oxidoreductase [Rhodospirillaceae bacterium]|nr:SDR family oxidoreductase [Rhodospirillaceae bacterium]
MAGRLDGRTAVVIGAAQGIGRGIAEVFLEQGARLAIGDWNAAAGEAAARDLAARGDVFFHRTDVSRPDSVEGLAAAALARFGRIDILVQNAGIYPLTPIESITPEEWDQVLAVNLKGCFLAARACLPAMKARRHGRMLFTASITGPRVSSPGHGHYSASKAGITGFVRAAAIEFAPYGITVNAVEPGNIMTEGVQTGRSQEFVRAMERSVPLGRLGMPRDVAHAFLYLASDEASYVTGTTIVVDGGQTLLEAKL